MTVDVQESHYNIFFGQRKAVQQSFYGGFFLRFRTSLTSKKIFANQKNKLVKDKKFTRIK